MIIINIEFSKNIHGGMVIFGILLLIGGFVLVFTTIPANLILDENEAIFQMYNLCNSLFGEFAQFDDSFREACQTVNMLFFLGVLLGIIGVILLIVGLVKKGN